MQAVGFATKNKQVANLRLALVRKLNVRFISLFFRSHIAHN